MNFKILVSALLIALVMSRDYPLYKQCDQKWGGQNFGSSSKTLCQVGCVVSSVAMALSGVGKSYDPGTLNAWLKKNDGYVHQFFLIWRAIDKLGLSYHGKIATNTIADNLKVGNIVILNVLNGGHWVLATSMVDDQNVAVNDPLYDKKSYPLSQIVTHNNVLYQLLGSYLDVMIDELQITFNVNGRRNKMMQADEVEVQE